VAKKYNYNSQLIKWNNEFLHTASVNLIYRNFIWESIKSFITKLVYIYVGSRALWTVLERYNNTKKKIKKTINQFGYVTMINKKIEESWPNLTLLNYNKVGNSRIFINNNNHANSSNNEATLALYIIGVMYRNEIEKTWINKQKSTHTWSSSSTSTNYHLYRSIH